MVRAAAIAAFSTTRKNSKLSSASIALSVPLSCCELAYLRSLACSSTKFRQAGERRNILVQFPSSRRYAVRFVLAPGIPLPILTSGLQLLPIGPHWRICLHSSGPNLLPRNTTELITLLHGIAQRVLPLIIFVAEEHDGALVGFLEAGLRSCADGCDESGP